MKRQRQEEHDHSGFSIDVDHPRVNNCPMYAKGLRNNRRSKKRLLVRVERSTGKQTDHERGLRRQRDARATQ